MKLSRLRGFVFNDITIDNDDFELSSDIVLIEADVPAVANREVFDIEVPFKDGGETIHNRYENIPISLVIGIYDDYIEVRKQKERDFLNKFVGVKSKLIFLNDPSLYYIAELIDTITVSEDEIYTKISLRFKASHCKYGSSKTIKLVNGENKIFNAGNYKAENIIKIKALANCEKIIISNQSENFTISNLLTNDEIYIDSSKDTVYKIENGLKVNAISKFSGNSFSLSPQNNVISVTGTNFNANIYISFIDTYRI